MQELFDRPQEVVRKMRTLGIELAGCVNPDTYFNFNVIVTHWYCTQSMSNVISSLTYNSPPFSSPTKPNHGTPPMADTGKLTSQELSNSNTNSFDATRLYNIEQKVIKHEIWLSIGVGLAIIFGAAGTYGYNVISKLNHQLEVSQEKVQALSRIIDSSKIDITKFISTEIEKAQSAVDHQVLLAKQQIQTNGDTTTKAVVEVGSNQRKMIKELAADRRLSEVEQSITAIESGKYTFPKISTKDLNIVDSEGAVAINMVSGDLAHSFLSMYKKSGELGVSLYAGSAASALNIYGTEGATVKLTNRSDLGKIELAKNDGSDLLIIGQSKAGDACIWLTNKDGHKTVLK